MRQTILLNQEEIDRLDDIYAKSLEKKRRD